jgi:hypothetical protein
VAVISLAIGAVLDLAIGAYSGKKTGEHALLRQLLHVFNPGDVVLGDCYYASFFLIATLIQMGVDFVFPMHSARDCDFRRGKRPGKKDHLAQWEKPARPEWMDEETHRHFADSIELREVEISDQRKGFRSKSRIVVTAFLDPVKVSKQDLDMLYDCRWFVEIDLRAIKETMGMDILRCKTPEMVRKEIWAHLLAYNLIRKIMAQAAYRHNKTPRELSFKLTMQLFFAFRQAGILSEKNDVVYEQLLRAIASKRVGNRPNRSEPRMVKRRPKPFPRLQKARSFYRHAEAA